MLWELAKHQDVQARLRREIGSVRAANGGAPLTAEDLDRMPYLQAVVKVPKSQVATPKELTCYFTGTFPIPPPGAQRRAQVRGGRRLTTLRAN